MSHAAVEFAGALAGLTVRTVIDKGFDGQFLDKLRNAAGMIHVVVRENEVVDLLDARRLCRCLNASGIATVEARPARIDENRFFRRE